MADGLLGFLGNLFGLGAGDPTIDAANQNKTLLSGLQTQGSQALATGQNQAGGYLSQVAGQYAPLADEGVKAGNLYADALGVNGADGNARATSAFTEAPGYQYALGQGEQAVDRGAAAHGLTSSGNWIDASEKNAEGLASQGYGDWLSQLGSTGSAIGSAVGSEGTALGNEANLATSGAGQNVDFLSQVANGDMGANNQIAAGTQANDEGLSNLFGNVVGGGLSYATGGLSGLAKYAQPKQQPSFLSGYAS